MSFIEFRSNPFIKRAQRLMVSSPLLPTGIAGIYLVYTLACFYTEGSRSISVELPPEAVVASDDLSQPSPDYLQISEWHLFGQTGSAFSNQATIGEAQLQLKLLGTFVLSKFPETLSAVIQTDDGSQKKYKIGDTLPDGTVLEDISAKHVFLSHNGLRESLTLQRLDAALSSNTEPAPSVE